MKKFKLRRPLQTLVICVFALGGVRAQEIFITTGNEQFKPMILKQAGSDTISWVDEYFVKAFMFLADEYFKKCYNDSTMNAYLSYKAKLDTFTVNSRTFIWDGGDYSISNVIGWRHREPTFIGFIEFLRKKGKNNR